MRWHHARHSNADSASPCSEIVHVNVTLMPRARQNSCASWPRAAPSYAQNGTPGWQELWDLLGAVLIQSVSLGSGRAGVAKQSSAKPVYSVGSEQYSVKPLFGKSSVKSSARLKIK